MTFFTPPPQTRYDIIFHVAGIPVQVHPLFWLMAVLFGASSGDFIQLLVWVVVVFISILIHELGHALVMRIFGQASYIVLYHFGGLAVSTRQIEGRRSVSLSNQQNEDILISLAGPFSGFIVTTVLIIIMVAMGASFGLSFLFGFIPIPMVFLPNVHWLVNSFVSTFLWVNIFWGLINLLPVYPLDGGSVARNVFIQTDPWDGVRKSLWLSVIAGALVAIVGVIYFDSLYLALLFGILAGQSYQALQGRR